MNGLERPVGNALKNGVPTDSIPQNASAVNRMRSVNRLQQKRSPANPRCPKPRGNAQKRKCGNSTNSITQNVPSVNKNKHAHLRISGKGRRNVSPYFDMGTIIQNKSFVEKREGFLPIKWPRGCFVIWGRLGVMRGVIGHGNLTSRQKFFSDTGVASSQAKIFTVCAG